MKNFHFVLAAVSITAIFAGVERSLAATIIHDETFAPGAWTAAVLGGTNITGAAVTTEFGTGIPGNALITTMSHNGAFTFDVLDTKIDRPWLPAIDGKILSIGWQFWYRIPSSQQYHGMFLAARQGDSVYAGPRVEPPLFVPQWQQAKGFITPENMLRRFGGGPLTMDFAPSAPPIYFGMLLVREIFSTGDTFRHTFYDLEIESVPEPNSLAMVSFLGASVAALGRRRNSRACRRSFS